MIVNYSINLELSGARNHWNRASVCPLSFETSLGQIYQWKEEKSVISPRKEIQNFRFVTLFSVTL